MATLSFDSSFSRRAFLAGGLASTSTAMLTDFLPSASAAVAPHHRHFTVTDIQRVTVKVPFREVSHRNMSREIPHWMWSEIFSVTLSSGVVGHGETLLYYTYGATDDSDVARAHGKNAVELMWDDDLGAGLQMALFDAVARTAGVPVYALLGTRLVEKTPVAWWNIDTSPDDMVAECQEAYRLGYRAYKTKGRPWFDVWEMVEKTGTALPDDFHVALDFNDTLLDSDRGIPILKELAAFPLVSIYETPIFQADIRGNQAIRKATRVPVAMHYGRPDPGLAIRKEIMDGFIIGGGASRVMRQGAASAAADLPFWLQIVGTGLTGIWSTHFGAVLSHATWPAVNCHQLFQHQLLTEPMKVKEGYTTIPDGPGLGVEIDWSMVEKFKVPKPRRRPDPARLIETSWPDGRRMYLASNGRVNFMLTLGQQGKIPYFERGVTTQLVPDDGSAAWASLHAEARNGPVWKK